MMNACPFDSFRLQKPSPICSIFTEEEWKGYNYAYDLTQFGQPFPTLSLPHQLANSDTLADNAGYGGPIGTAWGVGWVAEMIARSVTSGLAMCSS